MRSINNFRKDFQIRYILFVNINFIFIYLFIRHISYSTIVGSARNTAKKRYMKERTKKGEEGRENGSGQRAKTSTPTLVIDALIEEEEQNRKQIEEQKKETGNGSPTQLP